MVDFRKFCPIFILAIFDIEGTKGQQQQQKNPNQMVLKTTKVSVSLSCQF